MNDTPSPLHTVTRRLLRFQAIVLLTLATILRLRPRGKRALLAAYLAVFKAMAGALSPILAPSGALPRPHLVKKNQWNQRPINGFARSQKRATLPLLPARGG